MKKSAFSMLEVVFVIVVVGILAAAIIPRMDRDTMFEASEQVMSHIRYTQHLAMTDNVYDDVNGTWYKSMWQIWFRTCGGNPYYVVYRDEDQLGGNADASEAAADPHTGKLLYSSTTCADNSAFLSDVRLGRKYGIDTVTLTGDCSTNNNYIAFDNMGRPHADLLNAYNLTKQPCDINLTDGGDFAIIRIEPETGYVHRIAISD